MSGNNGKQMPMPPGMGLSGMAGPPQQIVFQYEETTPTLCKKCGGSYFDPAVKVGTVSAVHPRNPTKQDAKLTFPALLCRDCGQDVDKPVEGRFQRE